MDKHTELPWEYDRGFQDCAGYPGDHYTRDDDFLTMFMGDEAIDDFDPDIHNYALIYGPNQEANAAFIVRAVNNHYKLLKACRLALEEFDVQERATVTAIFLRNAIAEAEGSHADD